MRQKWADPEQRPALLEKQRAAAAKAQITKLNKLAPFTQKVLDFLCGASGPVTATDIQQALSAKGNQIRVAIRSLELRGLVTRLPCGEDRARKPGDGKGGSPKILWEIRAPNVHLNRDVFA